MATLIIFRHGQSEWNLQNKFTGWVDVELTEKGIQEAKNAGEKLKPYHFDFAYASDLKRAQNTLKLALEVAGKSVPTLYHQALNERMYGDLQGLDKTETAKKFGEEQVKIWRRSYDTPPPPIADDAEYSQFGDDRYRDLGEQMPRTECLKDVLERMLPYWHSDISGQLKQYKTVLVTAHGNSLRALVKHLDGISDADIAELNIPTGIPLYYKLNEQFEPENPGGEYLDPEAAAAGAAAVANQGKK